MKEMKAEGARRCDGSIFFQLVEILWMRLPELSHMSPPIGYLNPTSTSTRLLQDKHPHNLERDVNPQSTK